MECSKSRFQELVGVLVIQIIVLDFPRGTFQSHKIRRVRIHEVDLLAAEQPLVCPRQSEITADNTMLAEMPYIARPSGTRLCEFCIHIKVIFLCFTVIQGEQVGNLGFVEARE